MYKVTVKYRNDETHKTPDREFYAESSYDIAGDGRIAYWTEAKIGDIITIPFAIIREIVEKEMES